MKHLLILLAFISTAFAVPNSEQVKIGEAIKAENKEVRTQLEIAKIQNNISISESAAIKLDADITKTQLNTALVENKIVQDKHDKVVTENTSLKVTIEHFKTFARQIALALAIVSVIAIGLTLAQFTGMLPPPYSTYAIPILIGLSLAGGYIVYTTITIYASKIA